MQTAERLRCAALLRIVKAIEELLSEERPGDAEVH